MSEGFKSIILAFLVVDTAVIIYFIIYFTRSHLKKRKIAHFGDKAEEQVSEYIREYFPRAALLEHIFLPAGRGLTEIDHILICRWGVFVIETKSHNGKITVDKKEWIQRYGDKMIRVHSPLLQNETHIKAVKSALAKDRATSRIPVRGLVVFTSKKVYFTERVKGVIRLDQLNMTVKHGSVGQRYRQITSEKHKRYLSQEKIETVKKNILAVRDTSHSKIVAHKKAVGSFNREFNS